MQEFMDSIDFENMAREYNLKYNNANVLNLNKKESEKSDEFYKKLEEISSLFCFIKTQIKLLQEKDKFDLNNVKGNFLKRNNIFCINNLLHSNNNLQLKNNNESLNQNFNRIDFICKKIDEIEDKIKNI